MSAVLQVDLLVPVASEKTWSMTRVFQDKVEGRHSHWGLSLKQEFNVYF